MAKASVKIIPEKVQVVQKKKTVVTLELDREEASLLYIFMRRIGGNQAGYRGVADRISQAIESVSSFIPEEFNVVYDSIMTGHMYCEGGSFTELITFKDSNDL